MSDPAEVEPRALPILRAELGKVDALRQACDFAGLGRVLPDLVRDLHAHARRPGNGTRREALESELAAAESALTKCTTSAGAASILLAPDPVAAFDEAPLMIRRSVLDVLCVVRLHSAPRGSRTFAPSTVGIEWRTA